jgi:hypothetical protein
VFAERLRDGLRTNGLGFHVATFFNEYFGVSADDLDAHPAGGRTSQGHFVEVEQIDLRRRNQDYQRHRLGDGKEDAGSLNFFDVQVNLGGKSALLAKFPHPRPTVGLRRSDPRGIDNLPAGLRAALIAAWVGVDTRNGWAITRPAALPIG